MFICDDNDGATFSASLAPDADPARPTEVWLCATRRGADTHDRVYVSLTVADVRGLAAELAAMATEIETAQLEAETAAAATEEAAPLEGAERFCRTCGCYHTARQIREALGECPRWTADAGDTADMYPSTEGV